MQHKKFSAGRNKTMNQTSLLLISGSIGTRIINQKENGGWILGFKLSGTWLKVIGGWEEHHEENEEERCLSQSKEVIEDGEESFSRDFESGK